MVLIKTKESEVLFVGEALTSCGGHPLHREGTLPDALTSIASRPYGRRFILRARPSAGFTFES